MKKEKMLTWEKVKTQENWIVGELKTLKGPSSVPIVTVLPFFIWNSSHVLFDKYWSQEEGMSISCFLSFPLLYNSYILLMWAGGSPGRDKVIAANDAPWCPFHQHCIWWWWWCYVDDKDYNYDQDDVKGVPKKRY